MTSRILDSGIFRAHSRNEITGVGSRMMAFVLPHSATYKMVRPSILFFRNVPPFPLELSLTTDKFFFNDAFAHVCFFVTFACSCSVGTEHHVLDIARPRAFEFGAHQPRHRRYLHQQHGGRPEPAFAAGEFHPDDFRSQQRRM